MPKKTNKDSVSIQATLAKLEEIAAWFESDREFDIEEGLKKIKEGNVLVQSLKTKLADVENEFREIQKELDLDS